MNYIIDFYKELDAFNTILFWGVIIVILLLLIFSIIMANKNRKLERIIESKGINIEDDDELPIKKNDEQTHDELQKIETIHKIPAPPISSNEENNKQMPVNDIQEEQKTPHSQPIETSFIAEEYVMNNDNNTIPVFPKIAMDVKEKPANESGTYQKNLLREMALNQTSPIGITRSENNHNVEINKAIELQNNLSDSRSNNQNLNGYKKLSEQETREKIAKERYLKDVSDKLSQKNAEETLTRTAYELKQEEDAIISYHELMEKKDSLKMIDDEEAVISIDELIKRNKEKIYNITEETENNRFIDELKNFRSDL